MSKTDVRNNKLQELCRGYLLKLRPLAAKFGLGSWVELTVALNKTNKCQGTEEEVELLARACDDERVSRTDVPKILGKSYRQSFEDDDFDRVKRLKHVGIYSKISALLLGSELRALQDE